MPTKVKTWTEEEVNYLIENYPKIGKACAKKMGRTVYSIQRKASNMNLKKGEDGAKNVVMPRPTMHGESHPCWKGCGPISGSFLYNIRRCAKERDLEMNITIEELAELLEQQQYKCALSGVEIGFSKTAACRGNTASVDRTDSTKGYISGNVQWVHKDVNLMKMDFSQEEFIHWCKTIASYKR